MDLSRTPVLCNAGWQTWKQLAWLSMPGWAPRGRPGKACWTCILSSGLQTTESECPSSSSHCHEAYGTQRLQAPSSIHGPLYQLSGVHR